MAILNFSGPSSVESVCDFRGLCLSGDEGDRSSSDDERCVHDCTMDYQFSSAEHATCNSLTEQCVVAALSDGSQSDQVQHQIGVFYSIADFYQ